MPAAPMVARPVQLRSRARLPPTPWKETHHDFPRQLHPADRTDHHPGIPVRQSLLRRTARASRVCLSNGIPARAIICTSGAAPEYASQGRTPADIADEIVSLHCTDTRINPARRAWRLSPDWEFTQGDDYSDVTARRGDLTVTMRPHGDFRYRVNTPDGREIIQFAGSRAVRTLVDQCVRLARHD